MSAKNRDRKNRWRCKTVGFNVSPEENDQINFAVKLSGHTKQDFFNQQSIKQRYYRAGQSESI